MNPDSPKTPQEEMEARLIALLLGELSDQEAAAWRAAIATNPELSKQHDRLKQTISLVREATAKVTEPAAEQATPLKLSEERREKLLAHFKTVKPKELVPEKPKRKLRLVEVAAIVAIIGALAGISVPTLSNFRREETFSLSAPSQVDVLESGREVHAVRGVAPAAPDGSSSDYLLSVASTPLPSGGALFDSTVSPTSKTSLSEEKREPTVLYANTSDRAAGPQLQIVLPSAEVSESFSVAKGTEITAERGDTLRPWSVSGSLRGFSDDNKKAGAVSSPGLPGDPEWAGILERPESARSSTNQFLGRYAYSAPPARAEGVEHFYRDLNRNAAVDPATGLPVATPESGFSDYIAQAQRGLADEATRGSDRKIVDNRAQISGQLDHFYSDLNRTPPTAGAAIAMNGVEQSSFAGRGIAPTTGLPLLPLDDFSRDGAALGQNLAVTRADPALTRSYGSEPANRESGARGGAAGGGGAGGAGATSGDAFGAAQAAPGQVAAGDVVDGFIVTPTPALQPAKPQEAVPPVVVLTTESDADKAPARGESPTLGKLFQSDSSALASRDRELSLDGTAPRPDQSGQQAKETLAYDSLATLVPPDPTSGGVPVASAPVRRFRSAQTESARPSADAGVAWTEESLRRKPASVVLPSVETAGKIPSDGTVEQLALTREDKVKAATQVQDGRLLLEAGRLADAEVKLQEAIKTDPGNAPANYYLSLAKERRYAVAEAKREQDSKKGVKEVKQTFEKPAQLAQGRTESLTDQITTLEPEVRAAQKKVDELGEQLRITDLDAAGTAPAPMIELEKVRQLHAQLIRAEALLNREEAEAKALGQPVSEQRRGALQAQVDKLKGKVEQARTDDLAKAESNRPYYEAKLNLEEQVRLRSALNLKLNAEGVDLALPKTAQVEIVDRAEPATEKTGFWRSIGAPIGGTFQSAARVRVEPDQSDIQGFTTRSPFGGTYDPYFVQTEFDVIQSEVVLGKALEKLKGENLLTTLGGQDLRTEDKIAQLRDRLDLKPVRNSGLIEIRAKSNEAEDAAAVANAVADAYAEHRQERSRQLTVGGVAALQEAVKEQEVKIAQAQRQLQRVARESKVEPAELADAPIRKPATNAPIPQTEVQTSENSFSTFSLNVSDVSFKLAAASLEQGQMPDQASIRSEEFINAFDYRDPEPLPGVPVAFAWERARYPFAHNRDLLRFSIKTEAVGRQAGRPLNLVLLLDNSGSMERADRVQIIREALHVLAGQLQSQDKISVLTFARTPRLWVDGVSGDKAWEVAEQISELTPQGGTNFEEGMNAAYATALRHYLAGGINRVVMLTDGAANLGNVEPESLKQKVESYRKQGIALDCFGIGWEGFNDDLLEVLSRNGDGRYGFINSPEEAATEFADQLAGALQVAASDVKVQVEFNPARVSTYRQIGYAKHQLTKEQFRDNTVDAAEIAAQEAGNSLYTAEINPTGEGPLAIVRVRFKIPGTADYREHEWAVPYTGSAVSLEQASPAMRLAATASAFSEWLVASPFAAEVSPDALLGYLGGVPEIYGADARPKKLEWMIRQAKSIEGK